jgi:hypothetical protein
MVIAAELGLTDTILQQVAGRFGAVAVDRLRSWEQLVDGSKDRADEELVQPC